MTGVRWVMPVTVGRGSGLGNELIAWARAFLMAREVGAVALTPAFGRNARAYQRHFATPRLDWLAQAAARRALRSIEFSEADYLRHGGGDVGTAFAAFARERGLRERGAPQLVTTHGMWGGVAHVERAREFVRATLHASRFAPANLAELGARLDPERITVAMHVRLGDFGAAAPAPDSYRHQFNLALPLEWFIHIGRRLVETLGSSVQFQVFSDGSAAQLAPLNALLQPVSTHCELPADVSDLLALARADLLVCSVSSYSMWAAALSDAPYLWFEPQMHRAGEAGWRSVWGHEAGQQHAGSPTASALRRRMAEDGAAAPGRAHAVGLDGALPEALLDELRRRRDARARHGDLMRFGVVRAPA